MTPSGLRKSQYQLVMLLDVVVAVFEVRRFLRVGIGENADAVLVGRNEEIGQGSSRTTLHSLKRTANFSFLSASSVPILQVEAASSATDGV